MLRLGARCSRLVAFVAGCGIVGLYSDDMVSASAWSPARTVIVEIERPYFVAQPVLNLRSRLLSPIVGLELHPYSNFRFPSQHKVSKASRALVPAFRPSTSRRSPPFLQPHR
jgi:hypothetical protein